MSETAVRVDLRQANLSESAHLHEVDDRIFLALDQPPPVRSLLKLTIGEEQKAFEVGRVVEVVSEDEPARGCYGSFIDLDRLNEQAKVGSEHLQPGISGSGVPSPVVIMSTAEMMLGEAGSEESEAAAAGEVTPAAAAARNEQWEGSSTGDSDGSSQAEVEGSNGEPDSSDDESSDESDSSDKSDSSDDESSDDGSDRD